MKALVDHAPGQKTWEQVPASAATPSSAAWAAIARPVTQSASTPTKWS